MGLHFTKERLNLLNAHYALAIYQRFWLKTITMSYKPKSIYDTVGSYLSKRNQDIGLHI